eukprot:TRINITY_DN1763_c0_g1_i2.p1 TRINITY_DN1763_c0_g1~~TRINITY_DN1763_c0_g1_i2.p1  ORF type:complete len:215 (+),score=42.56 TRINITY_DN1763_c0_g1_i2:35-646(+)
MKEEDPFDNTYRFTGQAPPGLEPLDVETPPPPLTQNASHPKTVIAHLFFKIAALATFLFSDFITELNSNFVVSFIVTVIFIAVDFWITKNVSGRLLVGLRWWNEVKPDGKNEWIFESLENETAVKPVQSRIFWISLFAFPVVWFFLFLSQLFSLKWNWAILCALALALSTANVTGYVKCAKDARKRAKQAATNFILKTAVNQI